ncbi:CopL family metal-binding regulatory protein [Stenotrophomonas hibiscicola]|uniref:CopL family metal-binding regulatory protein n=1 Tax=Stenotrophomonas hibiscicola TaxID=86189 RepID=UPI003CE57CE7
MTCRAWLSLLLLVVLLFEGVFGAWAVTRMVTDVQPVAGGADQLPRECESTDRSRSASAETLVHSGHGKSRPPHGSSEPADCTCADVGDCECSCMLGLYPPMAVALLSTAHPPISLDMALPAPILPASKLSRVFRPPIA